LEAARLTWISHHEEEDRRESDRSTNHLISIDTWA
jgi:hypothetical protein